MSQKSHKVAELIKSLGDKGLDPYYFGYFECFNQQLFFEAHEVLEQKWLPERGQKNGLFYKGLIQLAGAFVHVQKRRNEPALALLKLARINLGQYPPVHCALDVMSVLGLIESWVKALVSHSVDPDSAIWPQIRFREGEDLQTGLFRAVSSY